MVLAPIDVAPDSLRVSAVDNGRGNLTVRLLGKSSDEIGAMAGIRKCDIIIDGQVADGAVRLVDGGTNAGLVLGFKTHAQAEAAAAALRDRNHNDAALPCAASNLVRASHGCKWVCRAI